MQYFIYAALTMTTLSACGGSTPATTGPSFTQADVQTPMYASSVGSLSEGFSGTIAVAGAGGYRFNAGYVTDTGPTASASLLAGTPAFTAPLGGTASMTGNWEIARATNLVEAGGTWSGDIVTDRGVITLDADFGADTLTGTSGDLTVAGTITDSQLGGAVTYNGLDGDLGGTIGGTSAIGIFTSTDPLGNEVYAGGFAVSED